jgi:threonine-phosphate decarboxylase
MVSSFAERAGVALLERYADYRARLPRLVEDKAALAAMLRGSPGFTEILEGPCFCLAKVDGVAYPSAGWLRSALLQHAVLVRACDGIPGMPPGWVRIQARGEDDTAALAQALRHAAGA